MVNSTKLPKKGLKVAHINICSLRNKLGEIKEFLQLDNIYILAISETHIDCTFEDSALNIQGYNIYRRDRNTYGGGVAIYIQNHIPVSVREDLLSTEIEALWLQVHVPHLKPLMVGCGYRPSGANCYYLQRLCEMIDKVCDHDN